MKLLNLLGAARAVDLNVQIMFNKRNPCLCMWKAVGVLVVTRSEETGRRNAFVTAYKFLPFLC